jgi:hypothetical protein
MTFQIADINGDHNPEIIAGTSNPGFIYIYSFTDHHWILENYRKYIWSTITNIAVGHFDGTKTTYFVIQNEQGSLFLMKMSESSLDLVWKSPAAWKGIKSMLVKDLDNDGKDEIAAIYQTGGTAIFKVVNNAVVSVWNNNLWGKTLGITAGD